MREMCDAYEMQFLAGNVTRLYTGTATSPAASADALSSPAQPGSDHASDVLTAIEVLGGDGVARRVDLDHLLVFFGLSPRLGPIANWGLDLKQNQIRVDTEKFQSSEAGLYAIGDINWYPGKKKLILSGFHEAALAAFAIKEQLNPGQKVHLQYTTTSPVMHQRLGVENPYADEEAA
jgi:thioredoxin reductase (NADPH)